MPRVWFGLIALVVAVVIPQAAFAQHIDSRAANPVCTPINEITEPCLNSFDDWFKAEVDYRKWMDANRNKPSYNAWWGSLQTRRERPVAPAWVAGYCEGTFQSDITSDQICPRYNAVKDYDWLADRNHALLAQLIQKKESPTNTSFIQRIHLDIGYLSAEFPSPHVYGLIGMHVGLVPVGPCEINVLPGTLLLRVPEGNGSKVVPSVTLGGGGCRLTKFKFPGTNKFGVLHANIAAVRIISDSSEQNLLGGSNMTLMGFSITMK
jgi:hypothetical protein